MTARRRWAALLVLFALFAGLVAAPLGTPAQAARESPFAAPGAAAAAPPPTSGPMAWVVSVQRDLHQRLAHAVKALKAPDGGGSALLALMALSFGYGAAHAVGPGHGKAVITAYVMADVRRARRALALTAAASLTQALTAIVIVSLLTLVLRATGGAIGETAGAVAHASYALLAIVGAWIALRAARALWRAFSAPAAPAAAGTSAAAGAAGVADAAASGGRDGVHDDGAHDHDHAGCCGHAHAITPEAADAAGGSISRALGVVLSVGLRPCGGALIVLVFAAAQGVYLAGVAAVLAMAVGAALAVAACAMLALAGRGGVLALLPQGRAAALGAHGLALAAGLVVTALAVALFLAPPPVL